jgi:hypothetical protein
MGTQQNLRAETLEAENVRMPQAGDLVGHWSKSPIHLGEKNKS